MNNKWLSDDELQNIINRQEAEKRLRKSFPCVAGSTPEEMEFLLCMDRLAGHITRGSKKRRGR